MKKILQKIKAIGMGILLLLILCVTGCSSHTEKQMPSLQEVMDRILTTQKTQNAVNYDDRIEDADGDAIILLCKSESGQYEAYGFISTEYGKKGILINNILDGGDNWNYFEESWSYGNAQPTLNEKGDYEVLFTFTQEKDGADMVREIYFDTYDTGTMTMRES